MPLRYVMPLQPMLYRTLQGDAILRPVHRERTITTLDENDGPPLLPDGDLAIRAAHGRKADLVIRACETGGGRRTTVQSLSPEIT
jgi:hypothetical protein